MVYNMRDYERALGRNMKKTASCKQATENHFPNGTVPRNDNSPT